MTRREIREQAFMLVFEKMFNTDATIEELASYAEESALFSPAPFAMELANKTVAEMETIDKVIAAFSRNWTLNRLPKVALALLRLAVSEMKYFEEIPVSVSINEAVELAKKYASSDDASYINGVLGAVSRSENDVTKPTAPVTEEEPENNDAVAADTANEA